MNDNLSQMVKEGKVQENTFSEADLDIPAEAAVEEVAVSNESNISIVSLVDWFDANVENFPNIRKPTVSIQGVDPAEQLIITCLVSNIDGQEKRKLFVFDDAHMIPVLDLRASDMQIYNNGFRIVYELNENITIKSYGLRTGLISVFCNNINGVAIPFATIRAKKRDTEIDIPTSDIAVINSKLAQPLDGEALQLRYKQSVKAEGLTTNLDGINWLLERQGDIEDVNHHLQIDNVIIETLA